MSDKEKDIKPEIEPEYDFEQPKLSFKERLELIKDDKKYRSATVTILVLILIAVLSVTLLTLYNKNDEQALDENYQSVYTSESIRINEYVVSNDCTFRDDNWNSPDWIEIFNYGSEPVSLSNFYISDDEANPTKYNLPESTLMPGEYILVLASGGVEQNSEYINVPFQLGKNDKCIIISTTEHTVDKLDIEYLPTDISAGYTDGGSIGYFSEPTPGSQNSTQSYDTSEIEPVNSYGNLLQINEYLSSNEYGITDGDGDHADWIEIYNPNSFAVYAGDIYLSDDENQGNKLRLPEIEIQPYEYIIVYASGKTEYPDGEIHAPFKLSENDSKIVLFSLGGYVIDSCDVYYLPKDVSAGKDASGQWGYFTESTPGMENATAFYLSSDNLTAEYVSMGQAAVVLNEWMPNNEFGMLDAEGDASDWIELYNTTGDVVSLKGFFLTDDINELNKWAFPEDAVIEPYGYLVVYASGKDETIDGQMHTSFALGSEEAIYLVSADMKIADSAQLEEMPGNVSKGKTADGYGYFALPTPGRENTTAYFTEINNSADFLHTNIYISEAATGKVHLSRFRGKSMYEYIEIYNDSDEYADLTGYTIYESSQSYYTFQSGVSIRPHGHLLVSVKGWVSETIDAVQAENLSLNSSGERLYLLNAEGTTVDCFDTGYLLGDYSSGRIEGYPDTRVFFMDKTPGDTNSTAYYTTYTEPPEFSKEGGAQDETFYLAITAAEGAVIYYTLDGSTPDADSKVYTGAIAITSDSIVRAVARSSGKLPSLCTTRTYILEMEHDIPVFCISTAPAGMFYDNSGIYANGSGYGVGDYPYFGANYFWNVERQASFEYYTADGELALAFDGGIQIAGGYSRANAQKSLAIRLRDEYGLSEITYPFFESGTNTFQHLFLRNGGQDGYISKMRDAFIQNCAYELGTLDGKRGTPVAVYINGQYWGLYNLRDKLNEDYFRIKYDYGDDVQINILTEYSSPKAGDDEDWLDLKAFCLATDFSVEENYNLLAERVDVQAFTDYIIIETFFGNADTHNINFWKAEVEGGKWKPVLFDLDLAIFDLGYSMVDDYLNNYLGYHDFVLDALKESDIFMDQLLERYSYLICNVFTEEYLISEIEEYAGLMDNEMHNNAQKWTVPSSYEKWADNIEKMKIFMIKRRNDIVDELQEYYGLSDEEINELFPYHAESGD